MITERNTSLWEILIPTEMISRKNLRPESEKEPTRILEHHHRGWDKLVSEIAKGLTLLPRVRGRWKDSSERSIPVRIACNADEMKRIAEFTMEHYNQEAVLYWCVSESVTILERVS